MKPFWRDLLFALTMGMLVPGLVLHLAVLLMEHDAPQEITEIQIAVTEEPEPM